MLHPGRCARLVSVVWHCRLCKHGNPDSTKKSLAAHCPLLNQILNALVRANVTPRTLRSSSERRLALPSVQARQSRQHKKITGCSLPSLESDLKCSCKGKCYTQDAALV